MKRTFESNQQLKRFSLETESEFMKPSLITNETARKFPHVDYHYHTATLGARGHCCIKPSPSKSLRDISRDYFDREANSDFLSDSAVFVALIAAAIAPIVTSASAVLELFKTLPF